MFTGLIERKGLVENISERNNRDIFQIDIHCGANFDVNIGDSVAVNGCCLTVTAASEHLLSFEASRETLAKTDLGFLKSGHAVNLERAVKLSDRLGGHLVAGHVDGVATVDRVETSSDGWAIQILIPSPWHRLMIPKGSVTLAGVSLTINKISDLDSGCRIEVMVIPTTLDITTIHSWTAGLKVNFEADLVGKHLQRLAETASN